MTDPVRALMATQDGVISRAQAIELALTDAQLRRLVRRREWARVHPGVFVDHTGPLTWQQRAWAAVLYAGRAALFGESALRAADGPGRRNHDDAGPIHIALDRHRQCVLTDGVVIHRVVGLEARAMWNTSPPRMRVEEAVLDLAAGARTDFSAIAVISQAVQARRTTAERILRTAERRTRLTRRTFIVSVLRDVRDGTCSALEHAYLERVERAHGLSPGTRQVAASSRGPIFRDVLYPSLEMAVELDGRLDHSDAQSRDRDLERDLDATMDGLLTVRLGWGQSVERPCLTAEKLARLMTHRGWAGSAHRCPACDGGDSQSPGDWESPRSA